MSTAPERARVARSTIADFHLLACLLIASSFVGTRLVAAYGEITGTLDAVLVGEAGVVSIVVAVALPILVLVIAAVTVAAHWLLRIDVPRAAALVPRAGSLLGCDVSWSCWPCPC